MPKAPCLMPVLPRYTSQAGQKDHFDILFLGQLEADIRAKRLCGRRLWSQPGEQKVTHDPQKAPRHRGPAKWGLSL